MTIQECLCLTYQPFHRIYTSWTSLFLQDNVIKNNSAIMTVVFLFMFVCYAFPTVVLGQSSVMQFCMAELETKTVTQSQVALEVWTLSWFFCYHETYLIPLLFYLRACIHCDVCQVVILFCGVGDGLYGVAIKQVTFFPLFYSMCDLGRFEISLW